jgi:hypothetical protein
MVVIMNEIQHYKISGWKFKVSCLASSKVMELCKQQIGAMNRAMHSLFPENRNDMQLALGHVYCSCTPECLYARRYLQFKI